MQRNGVKVSFTRSPRLMGQSFACPRGWCCSSSSSPSWCKSNSQGKRSLRHTDISRLTGKKFPLKMLIYYLKVLIRKNNLFQRSDFQEVFDPPQYELFTLRDKVGLLYLHIYANDDLFKMRHRAALFSPGNVCWPWGAVRGAAVPPRPQKVLIRFPVHPRTPLWLPSVCQHLQSYQRCVRHGPRVHGAPPISGGTFGELHFPGRL